MPELFRSPKVQYLIDRGYSLLIGEIIGLSCPFGNTAWLHDMLQNFYEFLLLVGLVKLFLLRPLRKQGIWRRHQPFELPSIYAIIFLLLGNWYGLAETDFFTGRLWLHLVTFTLPVALAYAWNYRKNFLVPEA